MTPQQTVDRIIELQDLAETLHHRIAQALGEANELTEQFRKEHGVRDSFSLPGMAYRFTHKAIGYGIAGNRDWLEVDRDTTVIHEETE